MKTLRRIFLLLVLLSAPNQIKASHIVGGEIVYEYDSTTNVFTVVMTQFQDCCPTCYSGWPSGTIRVVNQSNNSTITTFGTTRGPITSVPASINAACVTGVPSFCLNERVYTGTFSPSATQLATMAANGFRFEYDNDARNGTINNLVNPSTTGITWRVTTTPAGVGIQNSTPAFTVDPPTVVASGAPTTVNFSATDADGDSLWYEWTTALDDDQTPVTYASGYSATNPLPSTPAATINGNSGVISANLTQTGQFVIAVAITEFRNGVALSRIQRDYQFNLATFNTFSGSVDPLSFTPITCANPTGTLGVSVTNGATPITYAWNTGATTAVVPNQPAGTYTVIVTDNNGCQDTVEITLADETDLNFTPVSTDPSCDVASDGTISASLDPAQGPYTFVLSPSSTPTTSTANSASWNNVSDGTYTLVVNDTTGNCVADQTFVLTDPPVWHDYYYLAYDSISCYNAMDGGLTITGTTPGVNFSWSDGGSGLVRTGLDANTYTMTISTPAGCTEDLTARLNQPTQLTTSISSTGSSCPEVDDGTINFTASGGDLGLTYQMNGSVITPGLQSGLADGTYFLFVEDGRGCSETNSVTISPDLNWHDYTLSASTNPTCSYNSDGTITLSGTTTGLTFNWSDGGTGASRTGLGPGTFDGYITNAAGCDDTLSATMVPPPALTLTTTQVDLDCFGDSNGSIDLSVAGGTGGYTYSWTSGGSPVGTTEDLTGLTAGTYDVTVTDANSCTGTISVTLTEPTQIVLSTTSSTSTTGGFNINCNGGSDGSINLSAVGGTGAYSYSWTRGGTAVGNTANISNLIAGVYTVVVRDANNCTATVDVTLTEPPVALSVATSMSTSISGGFNINCNGGSDGTATATPSGGTGAYTYSWSDGQTTATATGLVAGTYTVTVTDENGCTESETVTLTEPAAGITLAATLSTSTTGGFNLNCNGDTDGTATVNPSGGTGAYTYLWSDGQTTQTATGLAAGTYSVTVTDANSCTATTSVTLTEPAAVVSITTALSASTTGGFNINCNGGTDGTATATPAGGTGAYAYSWSDGQTVQTATGLVAGTYTITVTDDNACTATETVVLTEPANPISLSTTLSTSIAGGFNLNCNGDTDGTATVTPSGGTSPYTYLWSDGQTGQTATGLAAGTYTVVVTDANACTESETVTLSEPAAPITLATSLSNSIAGGFNINCNGGTDGTATVTPSGGTAPYTYSWSDGQNTQTATGLAAGSYTVTVTDANSCVETATVTLSEPPTAITLATTLSSSINGSFNINCNGGTDGTATVNPTGGTGAYTYSWSDGQTSQTATGLAAGTYTVTVTDANGCTANTTVTLVEPPAALTLTTTLSTSIDGSFNINCNGGTDGTATVNPTGGSTPYTYLWSDGQVTQTATGLAAGTYSVVVTDGNNCTANISVTLSEPATPISLSIVGYDVSCFSGNDGSLDLTALGGTGTLSYLWDDPTTSTSEDISGLSAGTYTVVVTDINGCSDNESVVINQPTVLVLSETHLDNICNGGSIGSIDLSVAGGTPNYTYLWDDPANSTTQDVSGLTAGTYTVIVTDANLCTDVLPITINEPTALVLNTTLSLSTSGSTNINCNGGTDGSVTLSVAGGTTPYTYDWTSGGSSVATSQDLTNVGAGVYKVVVTDNNGCQDSVQVTLTEPAAPISLATSLSTSISGSFNINCNGGTDGTATVTPSGGTTPYTYAWSDGQNTATATGLAAGNISVVVTDANGCADSVTLTLTEPAAPLALTTTLSTSIAGGFNINCNGGTDGSATVNPAGGTAPYTYAWSDGQSTATATGLAAGTYTITVTDANNCTETALVTLTEPAAAITVATTLSTSITGGFNINCNGGNDGTATANPSGGTAPYTYSWSDGQTSATATGLVAGTYTVTVTDTNGCIQTASVTLTEPAAPIALAATLSTSITGGFNINCNGGTDGTATVNPSGGTAPYTYAWSDGQTTQTATGLAAGNITVVVTDANGCVDSVTVGLTEPAAPISLATSLSTSLTGGFNINCNGGTDGTATVTPSGGTAPYTYLWSDGQNTQTATGLSAGNITVVVTDANGCTDSVTVGLTEPAAPISLTTTLSTSINGSFNINCNGGNDGTATVNPAGGTAPYTYLWSDGQNTQTATGLTAGNYSVVVTDANGCSDNIAVVLTEPAAALSLTPGLSSSITGGFNINCNGGTDGTATATPAGGTAPYTYAWSNGQTADTATGLAAGTYTVVVTDANGCADSLTVTLTEPPTPISIVVTTVDATGAGLSNGSATANPSGGTRPYTYAWSDGQNTATATGLAAGTYTVVVTDANGCSDSSTALIGEPSALVLATNSTTNILCFGDLTGAIDINVAGAVPPYTYDWQQGGTSFAATQDVSGLAAGTYTVDVTDFNGNTAAATFTLTQPAAPIAIVPTLSTSITGGFNINCNGGSDGTISLAVTGGTGAYTYSWTRGGTAVGSTQNLTGLIAGTYIVTVTDANGCGEQDTITLTEPAAPIALATTLSTSITGSFNINCNGGSDGAITLGVSGGTAPYTYNWTLAGAPFATTQNLSTLSAGTYTVVVTDANNCTATTTVTLTEPAAPIALATTLSTSTTGGFNINCNGGSDGAITLGVSGGTAPYTYNWTLAGAPFATTQNLSTLSAGTYTVVVTDANNCTETTTVTLTEPAAPIALATTLSSSLTGGLNINCNGGNDGSATVNATGGTAPYTYLWNDGQNTATATGLVAGTYSVVVTDANSCTATTTVTLTDPAAPLTLATALSTSISGGFNINCNGGNDGNATVTPSGGTAPYTYSWSDGQTSATATTLTAGTYTVVVTDANNCTQTATVTLTEPPAGISLSTTLSNSITGGFNINCNGGNDGTATVAPVGGTAPYTYSWSDGQTTATASGLIAGTYTVVVTDANNCTATTTITLTEPAAPIALATTLSTSTTGGFNINCNGGNDGAITLGVSGGTAPYTYNWTLAGAPFATTQNLSTLSAGTYTVVVTDANNCTETTTVTLTEPAAPIALATTQINVSCHAGSDASIDLSVSGGTSPYTYAWDDAATTTTQDVNGLPVGTYTVVVTDANGCSDSISATITQPTPLSATYSFTQASCLAISDATVTFNASGGTAPLNYLMDNVAISAGLQSNLATGTYLLSVVDNNGCRLDSNLVVPADTVWNDITISGQTNPVCHGDSNGVITLTGNTAGLSFLWSDGGTQFNRSDFPAGTFQVVISNAAGCMDSLSTTLTQNDPLAFTSVTTTTAACLAANDGGIQVAGSGGAAPYDFILQTDTNQSGTFTQLYQGTYTVTMVDATGSCTLDTTVVVDYVVDWYNVTGGTTTAVRCAGTPTGTISITTLGGAAINQPFYWVDDPASGLGRAGLYPGDYDLVIDNGGGCVDTLTFTVDDIDSIDVVVTMTSELCFGDGLGSILLTTTGGTPPYSYNWPTLPGSTSPSVSGIPSADYYPSIVDDNGCIWTDTLTLVGPEEMVVEYYSEDPHSCSSNDGVIRTDITGGTLPYTIDLNGVTIPELYLEAQTGVQYLSVTDGNGCSWADSSTILYPRNTEVIFFADAFTPTADGINDLYEVRGDTACFSRTYFVITNRWGQEVFATDSPFTEFWDGTLPQGMQEQPMGIFQYRFFSAEYIRAGTFTMIR